MPSARVELAQIAAELAAAELRRDRLALELDMAAGDYPAEDLSVKLLAAQAAVARLEERQEALQGVPPPAPAGTPASPTGPAGTPEPEYVDTRTAARMLGVSTDTLERLRARGDGPPFKRIGRRVIYPVVSLRAAGTVQSPSGAASITVRRQR